MNRMSTTCPNCTLHLAVTAADLRVGQGYVRCGRCERVFNALISLNEDVAAEPQAGDVATGTTTVPAIADTPPPLPPPSEPPEQPAQPQDTSTGVEMVAAAFDPGLPAPLPVSAIDADSDDVDVVESMATGTFETIVLEGDAVTQTEEHVDEAEVDERLQQIADQIEADEFEHMRAELGVEEHTGENIVIEDSPEEEPAPDVDVGLGLTSDPGHRGWPIAAALLAVALLLQILHHNRQSLVEQAAGAWLAPVYGLFGVQLEPRWQLTAYDVRQLGGEALPDATERLILRATVLNRASHRQPPPVLRVTLQDRFGNALATHAIEPQNYLRSTPPARLSPDQRIDAELILEDPGNKAVGFELDACLPATDGRLRCASGS